MYSWQVEYIALLLETDESKLPRRLYEAIAAIEQRLLTPVEPGSAEDMAIKQASENNCSSQGRKVGFRSTLRLGIRSLRLYVPSYPHLGQTHLISVGISGFSGR